MDDENLDDLLDEIDRGPALVEWPDGSVSEARAAFTGNDDGLRYAFDPDTGAFVLLVED